LHMNVKEIKYPNTRAILYL